MPELTSVLQFYLPLGVFGLWRWGTWLMRRVTGWFYRPTSGEHTASVSVVTPVYMEDPKIFRRALESWEANSPAEIIAVIDRSDENCIREFEEFSRQCPVARLILTEKPGKRPALADGARASTGNIIAFADSDTVWSLTLLKYALAPFADTEVGGVATRQNVLEPRTVAQRIFDIQLDLRFYDDMMPSAVLGNAFTCLSGRTALYRREAVMPFLEQLVHETFWGRQCIGGDDKRLTYLVEAAGWQTRYQHNAEVYTPGARSMGALFRQRTRWSRNSWRADLRAMRQGWVWKHRFLSFILIGRFLSNLTLLLSMVYFLISLVFQLWVPAAVLALWWIFSRGLRISPTLARRPAFAGLLPLYVMVNFATSIVRIYALLTLNRQDWLTRGAPRRQAGISLVLARVATAAIIVLLGVIVFYSRF